MIHICVGRLGHQVIFVLKVPQESEKNQVTERRTITKKISLT